LLNAYQFAAICAGRIAAVDAGVVDRTREAEL
jgi:hypothetical protein